MADLYGYMENWHKAKNGQIFTPLHMGEFAARLIEIDDTDTVLDACCGSGALLYAGLNQGAKKFIGVEYDDNVKQIAEENFSQIDGIDYEIIQGDSLSPEVSEWIKERHPTKVLLNPPYERKYGCMKIVRNIMDSLEPGTKVAIFLPDTKFVKESKKYQKEFRERHSIEKIIKMPENLFFGFGVSTSIFILTAGIPQREKIYTCYISDDGFETVKNKGRQDVRGIWDAEKKDKYFDTIYREEIDTATAQELDAKYSCELRYTPPEKPFEIHEYDFQITALNYLCFKNGIDLSTLGITKVTPETIQLLESAKIGRDLYGYYKTVEDHESQITVKVSDFLRVAKSELSPLKTSLKELPEGETPVISAGITNNGIACFGDIEPQYQKGRITVQTLQGRAFYHNYPFSIYGHNVIVLEPKTSIPPLALQYVATIITKNNDGKYSYDNRLHLNELLNTELSLPAQLTSDKEPDWVYMAMKQKERLNSCSVIDEG